MTDPQAGTSTRRILGASLVGTAVEFYDFYIYATAASLVFGPLFFPSKSPSIQLLSAYASLAVAFVARPVGAAVGAARPGCRCGCWTPTPARSGR